MMRIVRRVTPAFMLYVIPGYLVVACGIIGIHVYRWYILTWGFSYFILAVAYRAQYSKRDALQTRLNDELYPIQSPNVRLVQEDREQK